MPSNQIDRILEAAVEEGSCPGVVAEVRAAGRICYEGAYGVLAAQPELPMRQDAIFRIASMTKLVTSVAVMMLVESEGIELDEPLVRYLPGFRQPEVLDSFDAETGRYTTHPARRDATIRELLSHTGGYGYWFLDAPLLRASGSPPDLFDPPFLMHEPGERFAYSSSADVVGQIVEGVTGMALDEFFARRIFAPLGMADTGFDLPRDADARLVRQQRRSQDCFVEAGNEASGNPVRGGGGLYSTARDYSRLLQCLLDDGELDGRRLLSPESVAAIMSNQIGELYALPQRSALLERTNDFIYMDGTQKFGFGVMVETRDQPGRRSAGSYGWGGILNTYFWVDPAAALTAVLMMQVQPFADPRCVELLRRFETGVYEAFYSTI